MLRFATVRCSKRGRGLACAHENPVDSIPPLAVRPQGLVLRCLPVLDSQQYYQIAVTLLKHLAVVLHRDRADNMLHRFYVCLQMVGYSGVRFGHLPNPVHCPI